ncbi:hypothetical protein [Asanoa ferruginea]|uniref:hypothetical protein n=1 Tax=Asanoa ferruginea TaxID=53367 RepID=UPI0011C0E35B|nr:hypothetical protein [Asanoa ferruginea]
MLLFTGIYGAYTVFPVIDGWAAFSVWFVTIVAGQADVLIRKSTTRPIIAVETAADRTTSTGILRRFGIAAASAPSTALVVVPIVVAWLAFYGASSGKAVTRLIQSDEIGIVISGLLLAVFVGNEVVALFVRRYLPLLGQAQGGVNRIVPLGIYVGWVERAVVFAFVAGGQSDAAALAIAAKALVRLPQVQDEQKGSILGQYIIMGTLSSTLISVIAAVAVRLAIGLPAL